MSDKKKEETAFTMKIDPKLRLDVRSIALRHGLTLKVAVERMFRLFVEADGIENLERIYRANRDE